MFKFSSALGWSLTQDITPLPQTWTRPACPLSPQRLIWHHFGNKKENSGIKYNLYALQSTVKKRTKKQIPCAMTFEKLRFAKLNCSITVMQTLPQELEGQNQSHSNVILKMVYLLKIICTCLSIIHLPLFNFSNSSITFFVRQRLKILVLRLIESHIAYHPGLM